MSPSASWHCKFEIAYLPSRFVGRVAVVTGAGRGIGRAHAPLLASRGAKVVVNDLGADVNGAGASAESAQEVVAEIAGASGRRREFGRHPGNQESHPRTFVGVAGQRQGPSKTAMEVGGHPELFQANWDFHATINRAANSPAIALAVKNTLRYFPDFSYDIPAWNDLAAEWQVMLLALFQERRGEKREAILRITEDCCVRAADFYIAASWPGGGAAAD